MALIDNEDAARRLARVIISDIELYNRERVDSGADIKSLVDEGFTLFRSRVAAALHPLYPVVVSASRLARGLAPGAAAAAAAALPSAATGPGPAPLRAPAAGASQPPVSAVRATPDFSSRPTPAQPLAVAAVLERELAHTMNRKSGTPPPLPARTPSPLTTPRPALASTTPAPVLSGEPSPRIGNDGETLLGPGQPTPASPGHGSPAAEGLSSSVAEGDLTDKTPTDGVTPLESPSYAALAAQERVTGLEAAGGTPSVATTPEGSAAADPGHPTETTSAEGTVETEAARRTDEDVAPEPAAKAADAMNAAAPATQSVVPEATAAGQGANALLADISPGEGGDDSRELFPTAVPAPVSEREPAPETATSSGEVALVHVAPSAKDDAVAEAASSSDVGHDARPDAAASLPADELAGAGTAVVKTPEPAAPAPLAAVATGAGREDTPAPAAKEPLDEPTSPGPASLRATPVVRTPTPVPTPATVAAPAPLIVPPVALPLGRSPDEPAPNLRPKRSPVTYVVLAALAAAGAAAYYFWQHRFY